MAEKASVESMLEEKKLQLRKTCVLCLQARISHVPIRTISLLTIRDLAA